MKQIALLGSTGSIGIQTLDICRQNPEKFRLIAISGNKNVKLLIEQAKEFLPKYVVVTNEHNYLEVKEELKSLQIEVIAGKEALLDIVKITDVEMVVVALVGYAGMLPTYQAVKNKKQVALANKESLVVAGDLIMNLAQQNNVKVLPIDSEHSAIFQSLVGEDYKNIEKIYLTASGGPFRDWTIEQIENATLEQALNHPNWSMGGKITIDSATMMNKGLEMIEAKWLFNLKPQQIDVTIHKESIIHSIVQFIDGSMKAQMGLPDMRVPIQYAMTYPNRINSNFKRFNFADYKQFNFQNPNEEIFKCLKIAKFALNKGGNFPCIMNAANEVAVDNFLNKKIKITSIPNIIEQTIEKFDFSQNLSIDDYINLDRESRLKAKEISKKYFL